MKTCTKCRIEKDKSNFYKHSRTADGLYPWCKSCASEVKKLDKAKLGKIDQRYGKGASLLYIEAYCEQEGYCNICVTSLKFLDKQTCYEHDHETGKFRGLTCRGCNAKLAWLDNKKHLILNHINK